MIGKRRSRALRMIGWLAVVSMLATAILGPAAAPTFASEPQPTSTASDEPTQAPSDEPTAEPTDEAPSSEPTSEPTTAPTDEPTQAPTDEPTQAPTDEPTTAPTDEPTPAPTDEPTPAPTDEPTPAPTDEPTPTPSTEPTPTPTDQPTPTPNGQAWVYVVKVVDNDGNEETDDFTYPAGWHYLVTVGGGTADPSEVVTLDSNADEDNVAFTTIALDGDSATVTLEEVLQTGYDLIDAVCFPVTEAELARAGALRGQSLKPAGVADIGELEGNTISFEVTPDSVTLCGFLNAKQQATATPSGGVEGATGTPRITPPSTDSVLGGATSSPANDTWRLMLIAMAALLATILVLTPATKTIRRK